MQKIIVTGSKGLIGSRFTQRYQNEYEIIPFDLNGEPSVDITEAARLEELLEQHQDAIGVIHFAAYTDVNGAYLQTNDWLGSAWQVNVIGTQNLARLCQQYNLYLIHLSTAYVFDGKKRSLYFEDDKVNPIEWYGKTKAKAEEAVISSGTEYVILRIDQPFSNEISTKIDTLHRIINGLENNELYPQFTNHYFGPTYIEDLIKIIDFCLRKKPTGIYHASSGEKWSDYDFALAVKDFLELPGKVKKGDLEEYLKSIERPYQVNTAMSNEKLTEILDFDLLNVKQAIRKTQL